MEKQQSKYRFERKFIIKPEYKYQFLFEVIKSGFSEIYEKRIVNNIYLDSCDLNNVIDNVEGISNRKKTRIRWYGDMFKTSKKIIELKIKSEDVNTKENIPLSNIKLSSLDSVTSFWETIKEQFQEDNNKMFYRYKLYNLKPTLINSYKRSYYINADESLRITLDEELFFYSPIYHTSSNEQQLIIEFKYNSDDIFNDNSFTNLELTKFSKYVKGILVTSTFNPSY